MSLSPGSRLGPYEILSPLGAGGMGEVYRAVDGKLGREVAVKVLPARLSGDAEALSRFEREARAVAALSHPNILSIFDFGAHEGTAYAVTELLEGETLRERLASGMLPARKAVEYAVQIAHGLATAHEGGVVHRDLKPDNLFLTRDGRVKILDFGLAKTAAAAAAGLGQTNAPTLAAATEPGTVMGTVGYMSPEQVRGRPADARSDIFSFGAVLYEMLTGGRAFRGDSAVETMNAILTKDPPEMDQEIPSALERTVRHCVEKNPEERFRSARDLAFALETLALSSPGRIQPLTPAGQESAGAARRFRPVPWPAAAAAVAAAGILAAFAAVKLARSVSAPPRPVLRFDLSLPSGRKLARRSMPQLAFSRDGSRIVYAAAEGDSVRLYVRALEQFEGKVLAGTEDADGPFFSPDGRWIGFFAGGKLKKVPTEGGNAITLCDAPSGRGASWGDDETIVFAPSPSSGLFRVPAGAGVPQVLTTPDAAKGENTHRLPEVLPGAKAVLFNAGARTNWTRGSVVAMVLATGRRRTLLEGAIHPRYVSSGQLVFIRNGEPAAVPFDPDSLQVEGPPVPLPERVLQEHYGGFSELAVSLSGSLAYVPAEGSTERTLVWVDRQGAVRLLPAPARPYNWLRVSPDGTRVAVSISADIWVYDTGRDTLSRLTFDGTNDWPIWSPDGKRLVFASIRGGPFNMYAKSADGSGAEERLLSSPQPQIPGSFSPDGRTLAFIELDPAAREDLWLLPLDGDRKPRPFLQTPFAEGAPALSPDGRWMAYESDESGRYEVYVRPYPGPGGKWQISSGGGRYPVWGKDARELTYWNGSKLMAAPIETKTGFSAGKPALLFEGAYAGSDVSPDGQRFLMIKEPENRSTATRINVVLGWFDDLRRRFAEGKP
ncbi:MAG: protein kinase domain-containing protein [Thermoanaerobaculia bacterium]